MANNSGMKLMTVEEFYTWSCQEEYDNKHMELVRGRPVVKDLPDPRHGVVCNNLTCRLFDWCQDRGTGYVCAGAAFIVGRNPDTVYAPDVAMFAGRARFEDLSDEWTDHAPHFLVEVRQNAEEMEYLLAKAANYHRIGIAEVWIADPMAREIGVYRCGQTPAIMRAGNCLTSDEALPGFRCAVEDIFMLPNERPKYRVL